MLEGFAKGLTKGLSKEGKKIVNTPTPIDEVDDVLTKLNEDDRKIFEENIKKEAQKAMKKMLPLFK